MQIWFWAAVVSAVMSGFGNFLFKIAAKRNYSSEMFSLYGGLVSAIITLPLAVVMSGLEIKWYAVSVGLFAGIIAAAAGVTKVYALRHIDTTIFFPLYKLISPLLAIIFALLFFGERFSTFEWFGMLLGLAVPLLLITTNEKGRQSNLFVGLTLLLIGAIISATAAALNKYSVDLWNNVWWLLMFSSLGVFIGSVLSLLWKRGFRSFMSAVAMETEKVAFNLAASGALVFCVLKSPL